MDLRDVRDLLEHQDGVVSRRQLLANGATDPDIRRWLRRRELTRIHNGVFVNHTGPLTWANRAWAAVLFYWPAALTNESAVYRAGETIHVAVDHSRTPTKLAGVRVHRLVNIDGRSQWHTSPPRIRLEDALLSMCGVAKTRMAALSLVTDACRRRMTTPARLARELEQQEQLTGRRWLLAVLAEASQGVQSVLESSYRRNVERAHGLPRPDRQLSEHTEDGRVYRDARYQRFALVIELDGRIGHELSHDRWDDQDRDLLAATDALLTLRLGWRHTESTPCRTAGRLALVLQARGWEGQPRACGPDCPIDRYLRAA